MDVLELLVELVSPAVLEEDDDVELAEPAERLGLVVAEELPRVVVVVVVAPEREVVVVRVVVDVVPLVFTRDSVAVERDGCTSADLLEAEVEREVEVLVEVVVDG